MASFSPMLPSQPHSAPWPHLASPPLTSLTLTLIFSQSPLIQSPSLSFTHQPTPTLTLTLMMWWLLFVTKEHRIVRSEHEIVRSKREAMIGGALGRVEVRQSPGVGLMVETTADGALVVWVLHFFIDSFPLSVVFVFGYLFEDSICINV